MNENLLSAISGLIDNAKYCDDKGVQQEILLLAQKHLNAIVGGFTKSIECVRPIYETDGFVPAIKQWRTLTGKGLKDAKEDVERAADGGKWKNHRIGQIRRITSTDNYFHGQNCTIIAVASCMASHCTVVLHRDGCEYKFPLLSLTKVA
jgi:hypothetical protein